MHSFPQEESISVGYPGEVRGFQQNIVISTKHWGAETQAVPQVFEAEIHLWACQKKEEQKWKERFRHLIWIERTTGELRQHEICNESNDIHKASKKSTSQRGENGMVMTGLGYRCCCLNMHLQSTGQQQQYQIKQLIWLQPWYGQDDWNGPPLRLGLMGRGVEPGQRRQVKH